MGERGQSLAETLVALGIFCSLLFLGLPALQAYRVRSMVVGAAEVFRAEFRRARSMAIRGGVNTALRFEEREDGVYLRIAVDGDYDGVRSDDLRRGIDHLVGPGRRLSDTTEVLVGIVPGTPAPPPARGPLDPTDPIRFGRSNMVSFSPLGGATPGTLYLRGRGGLQAAVRVTGMDGQIRTLVFDGVWRRQ